MQPLRRQLLGVIAGLVLLAGCQSVEEVPETATKSQAVDEGDFFAYAVKPSLTDDDLSCVPFEPGAIGCPPSPDAPDDKHVLYVNKSYKKLGKLLVFLPGTNVVPGWNDAVNGCTAPRCDFYRVAAEQGYHVIALSYFTANDPPAFRNVDARCNYIDESLKLACYAQYMNEVLDGTPECDESVCGAELTISQHPQDSIIQRLKSVLTWAHANHDNHGWDRYLETGNIKWGQVALAGSSLGASYAALLAQQRPSISRVALLASPNDGLGTVSSWTVAPWLENYCPNAQCPPFMYCPDLCSDGGTEFFGLVHEKNHMHGGVSRLHETIAAYRALGMGPVMQFDPEPGVSPNFQGAQVLISTDPETTEDEAHESVTQDEYDDPCPPGGCEIGYTAAWRHLFGSGL